MTRLTVIFMFAAAIGFAQKGDKFSLPDISPREVTHPDALDDTAHFRKQFENDRTRVLRMHLAADETSRLYESTDSLFVCFRECHVRLMDPAGHDQDVHLQDGETRWVWAGMRSVKNLSTQPVDMLFVEFRAPA